MIRIKTAFLQLLLCIMMVLIAANDDDKPETWYTRYKEYPEYCSTPSQMSTRDIPELKEGNRTTYGETRILHVSALIRHGARTPWSSSEDCFPKVMSTVEWDCRLTTIMAPPNGDVSSWDKLDASFFLFEKEYDALPYRKDGLSNELNGTCQVGQLLLRGYEQELLNGKFLRDRYTYTEGQMDHDERMRLIDMSFGKDNAAWTPNHLRYRADNDQRTIMSGQVLLRGLFGEEVKNYVAGSGGNYPVIPLHIADR